MQKCEKAPNTRPGSCLTNSAQFSEQDPPDQSSKIVVLAALKKIDLQLSGRCYLGKYNVSIVWYSLGTAQLSRTPPDAIHIGLDCRQLR